MYVENSIPEAPPRAAFSFFLVMTIVITGCLMAICYLAMLKAWYGEVGSASARTVPAAWANGLHVVVVNALCPGENAEAEVKRWQQLLRRAGIPFETHPGVPQDSADGAGVWVLPSTECLSERSRGAIRRWLGDGGGVVATGALGLRDEQGRLLGSPFLLEIAGAEVRPMQASDSPLYLALAGQPPLTLGLMPGERWRVQTKPPVATNSFAADGYWFDAGLEPLGSHRPEEVTAITHRSTGQGRVVWIGAGLDAVSPSERNLPSWERLFLNSVRWVGRRPLAAVSAWPEGHRVAVVVAQEIHEAAQIPDALSMARLLSARQIPATFFVRSPLDGAMPQLNELARIAEVGVLGVAEPQTAQQESAFEQRDWLQRSLRSSVRGFRFQGGRAEESTLGDLARAGYAYYLGSSAQTSAAPRASYFPESRLFPLDPRVLVGLPVLGRDDFQILSRYEGPSYSEEGLVRELWRDFEKVQQVGGVYVLNHRADLLGSSLARPALLRLLERIRQKGAWTASASDVAHWWQQRQKIDVEVSKLSRRRMRIIISNMGAEDMHKVLVVIALPYVPSDVRLSSAVFGMGTLGHRLIADRELLQIRVERVKAQTSQIWLLDLM